MTHSRPWPWGGWSPQQPQRPAQSQLYPPPRYRSVQQRPAFTGRTWPWIVGGAVLMVAVLSVAVLFGTADACGSGVVGARADLAGTGVA